MTLSTTFPATASVNAVDASLDMMAASDNRLACVASNRSRSASGVRRLYFSNNRTGPAVNAC